jgi:hypothetical protein
VRLIDPAKIQGRLVDHLTPDVTRVLIVFLHGVGDLLMFQAVLESLRRHFPAIQFDLALAEGLGQEIICPTAVLLPPDWPARLGQLAYDIVFLCHFPLEDPCRPTVTKSELCCEQEIGIPPVSGHPSLATKPLVAVHFQSTAVPEQANAPYEVAHRVWADIVAAGCVPVETHFEHAFHNPLNVRYGFADRHVRSWPPRLDTLIAVLGASAAFVGVVSGNFHLALSLLGHSRVLLLERSLKATQFSRIPIATANLLDYRGEVRSWLAARPWEHQVLAR